jgi:hypothetical protein
MLDSNEDPFFVCALCGETFLKEIPDAEAMAETRALWGDLPDDTEFRPICGDCFHSRTLTELQEIAGHKARVS